MASASPQSGKVGPIVSPDEVQWLTALGLGRGVDATKPNLWMEKSTFQAQSISKSLDNIIATSESGARKYFEREVLSISSRQTHLKLSVVDPNTSLQIGVDAMYSRSVTKTSKSIGEEVATRTISFRRSFDELPSVSSAEIELEKGIVAKRPSLTPITEKKTDTATDSTTTEKKSETEKSFEEQLSDWLVHRARVRGSEMESSGKQHRNSITELTHFLQTNDDEAQKCVIHDCLQFVKQLGVTHYVHSIQLGAKKFRVLSSTQYNQKVGVKGSAGAKIAKLQSSISQTASKTRKNSSLKVEEIGKIADGSVRMGTTDEAVISFQLMPIQTLITSEHIHNAMKRAVRDYMVKKATRSQGPFLISCANKEMRLYWKVDDFNKVIAIPDVTNASIFFLTSTDDEEHPYEFMITYYYGEDKEALMKPKGTLDPISKEEPLEIAPLPLYLNGPVSLFGYNNGPLEVKPNVIEENARFVLHNRVFESYAPVDIHEWEHGEEFFISCSRRRFKWDGYIAVKTAKSQDEFSTAIVPTQQSHSGVDTWLLFRLMPVELKTKKPDEQQVG